MSTFEHLLPIEEYTIDEAFLHDVLTGLSHPQKSLPCKYFYDEKGSQLFEAICETPEYYVTRTECEIYDTYANQMAATIGSNALIIEPGAGSTKKISYLLAALKTTAGFIPMDISPEILADSSQELKQRFPSLEIKPTVVDFSDQASIAAIFRQLPKPPSVNKRVVFFPGSTIGNFKPEDAVTFLKQFSTNLHSGDGLLIGVDRVKEPQILESAYDDAAGITAQFNRNLLCRINQELNANFDLTQFAHKAVFNPYDSRIEMYLVSQSDQQVRIGEQCIAFAKHETIHTENSYKYTLNSFREIAASAGFRFEQIWSDTNQWFSVYYFSVM